MVVQHKENKHCQVFVVCMGPEEKACQVGSQGSQGCNLQAMELIHPA